MIISNLSGPWCRIVMVAARVYQSFLGCSLGLLCDRRVTWLAMLIAVSAVGSSNDFFTCYDLAMKFRWFLFVINQYWVISNTPTPGCPRRWFMTVMKLTAVDGVGVSWMTNTAELTEDPVAGSGWPHHSRDMTGLGCICRYQWPHNVCSRLTGLDMLEFKGGSSFHHTVKASFCRHCLIFKAPGFSWRSTT